MSISSISEPKQRSTTDATWAGRFELAGEPIWIRLEASDAGVTRCELLPDEVDVQAEPVGEGAAASHVRTTVQQLREYFARQRQRFDLKLAPAGTDFQKQVWKAARQIPFGQTRSYWWIAVRIGNPHAMRAVGSALGANPLLLFVPCHRVLRQDGALGGFACGIAWKQKLLKHEGFNV
jgi:methylated-DNA-[protein]-cysteine S-methyltransferase